MLQIKWMNLLSEEPCTKRTTLTAEDPELLHLQALHNPSICSSQGSIPHSTLVCSGVLPCANAPTHFAQADCIWSSTAQVSDLMINSRRHLYRQMKFTNSTKTTLNFASSSFIHYCTSGRSSLLPESWLGFIIIYYHLPVVFLTQWRLGNLPSFLWGGITALVTLKWFPKMWDGTSNYIHWKNGHERAIAAG